MPSIEQRDLSELAELFDRIGVRRFWLVWDTDQRAVRASHSALQPLANRIAGLSRDFDEHEGVFVQREADTGVLFSAAIHRTVRGQGAGGVRLWRYERLLDLLVDGLRLSRGMTRKNALAGLWWGGAKGVIGYPQGVDVQDPATRHVIYENYGRFITSLRGCYVTAEDVGTHERDMAAVHATTRFTTCIPAAIGGSGNPSIATARGVVKGMEAALAHLEMGGIESKTIAVQGLGNVSLPMIGELRELGADKVIASDIDPRRVAEASEVHGDWLDARLVDRGDNGILAEQVHIVAPCAVGGVLNEETIGTIKAPIVCGAANNQLADPLRDDRRLQRAGVLFMPDFLVNRMGIVNCADEQYGYADDDERIERHLGRDWDNSIHRLSLAVLERATETGSTPAEIARRMADRAAAEPHPIWGHRGQAIIRSLVESGWAEG